MSGTAEAARLDPDERSAALAALAGSEQQVLVVGGGVTGAGVALDAATRGLSVGLLVLKMTRQHASRPRPATTPLMVAPPPGPAVVLVRPASDATGVAGTGPDPRLLRDATLILQNASARGQRLSQRTLARELRGHGHHFPNDHLHQIAETIGLAAPRAA